jgi:hypothetical protein
MAFNGDLAQQQFWEAHVRSGSKADVTPLNFDVRFTPNSGHSVAIFAHPLWAKLGHRRSGRSSYWVKVKNPKVASHARG